MHRSRLLAAPVLLLASAALAACGGGTASPSASSAPSASSSAPAASPSGSDGASPSAGSTEIVAVDYKFENAPASVSTGTTFTLRNEGAEVHELLVVRRNVDVTQSWEELLALPQDQAENLATVVGNAFALPGATAEGSVTVTEAGDYLMVCFVPTGTKSLPTDPGASLGTGAPHFTQGMLHEFTVTD